MAAFFGWMDLAFFLMFAFFLLLFVGLIGSIICDIGARRRLMKLSKTQERETAPLKEKNVINEVDLDFARDLDR